MCNNVIKYETNTLIKTIYEKKLFITDSYKKLRYIQFKNNFIRK